jgi:hypothetical protein
VKSPQNPAPGAIARTKLKDFFEGMLSAIKKERKKVPLCGQYTLNKRFFLPCLSEAFSLLFLP